MHIRKEFKMKKVELNTRIIASVGIGAVGLLTINSILMRNKLKKLSKSYGRFTNIITETEEERQRYEFEHDLRIELLEDMMKDIYKDIEIYGEFEEIDGEVI